MFQLKFSLKIWNNISIGGTRAPFRLRSCSWSRLPWQINEYLKPKNKTKTDIEIRVLSWTGLRPIGFGKFGVCFGSNLGPKSELTHIRPCMFRHRW